MSIKNSRSFKQTADSVTAYFHVGNGGLSVGVSSVKGSPKLHVNYGHFGNPGGTIESYIQPEVIDNLIELLQIAKSELDMSAPYTNAAESIDTQQKISNTGFKW